MKFDDNELYSIPSSVNGTQCSLHNLAKWKNGLAFKKINFSDEGVPVIKIAELNNGIGPTTAYTKEIFSEDVHLKRGDLLFSWSGNPQTSIDTFRFDLEEGWLNQHIFKVTPNEELVDFDYFYFLMKNLKPYFTKIATNKQTTGLGHVTLADIKRMNLTDVAKVAYPKFLEKLSVCRDMFHGYDYSKFTGGTDLERAKTISGAVNFIMDREKVDDKDSFVKEALMLHQALSLCSSLVDEESRFEAAFFESVRVLVIRLTNTGVGKKISLPEMNARINELLKQSIKSDGVINLFSDIKEEFSLFDPKFLEEVASMKEKNLAVELLKKLIAEQVSVYRRTNVVKSEKFSEIMQRSLNAYLNGMLTNEEVIEEMLNLAKQIAAAKKEGDQLGLTADELAFYDALTKPQAIKDFYENEELIAITKELADTLRRNKTIDWQKRESARAKMRMLIKKLLKKHKYPPEGMEDAVQTVMTQCELWTDNNDMGEEKVVNFRDKSISYAEANYAPMKVAESTATYGAKK